VLGAVKGEIAKFGDAFDKVKKSCRGDPA